MILGSTCKERWESLRAQYRKFLHNKKTKSGQAAVKITKWKFEDHMCFLGEFMKDRIRVTSVMGEEDSDVEETELIENINEDEEETQVDREIVEPEDRERAVIKKNPTTQLAPKVVKRYRKTHIENTPKDSASATLMKFLVQEKQQNISHPIDTFFSLMASSVKNFNLADQHFIKNKIFSLVSNIEEKYLLQNQNLSTCHRRPQQTPPFSPSPISFQYGAGSSSSSPCSTQPEYATTSQQPEIYSQIHTPSTRCPPSSFRSQGEYIAYSKPHEIQSQIHTQPIRPPQYLRENAYATSPQQHEINHQPRSPPEDGEYNPASFNDLRK